MKVLFANPPWWEKIEFRYGVVPFWRAGNRAGSRWPHTTLTWSFPGWRMPFEALETPLFMGYAASYVAAKTRAQVVLRDSIARRESYRSFYKYIEDSRFDYVFIETSTPSWEHDRRVVERLCEISPESRLVLCGPNMSVRAESIVGSLPVLACIKGEYEKSAVQVLGGQAGVLDFNFLTEQEMNDAPAPMYDEQLVTAYYDRNPRGCRRPHLRVWGSRGCPFRCIFCVWPATMTGNDPDGEGRRLVRYYHPSHLEPFIRKMVARHRFRSIYFDDDTFNLGDRHTFDMCGMMRRLGLPWGAMCRTDTISMGVWDEMKKSGCYGVKLGFESGSQHVIDHIVHKKLDLSRAVEVVRHLKAIDMTVHGTFTIGLPGETPEQMQETLRLAASLPLDSSQISGTAELEGTPLSRLSGGGDSDLIRGSQTGSGYLSRQDGTTKGRRLMEMLRGKQTRHRDQA